MKLLSFRCSQQQNRTRHKDTLHIPRRTKSFVHHKDLCSAVSPVLRNRSMKWPPSSLPSYLPVLRSVTFKYDNGVKGAINHREMMNDDCRGDATPHFKVLSYVSGTKWKQTAHEEDSQLFRPFVCLNYENNMATARHIIIIIIIISYTYS
jgi:hypothetical protein